MSTKKTKGKAPVVGQKIAPDVAVNAQPNTEHTYAYVLPVVDPLPDNPLVEEAATEVETPEAFEARIKAEKITALQEQVASLAGDKAPGKVVYRFKTDRGETGSNLGFYLACKMHEIENDIPCNLLEPVGPPVSAAMVSGKGMQALGTSSAVKTSFCKNC